MVINCDINTPQQKNINEQFIEYLDKRNVLSDFVKFADNEGVAKVPDEIKISEKILKTQLNAFIARNIIDNEGFYPIIRQIDLTLQEAIKILDCVVIIKRDMSIQ